MHLRRPSPVKAAQTSPAAPVFQVLDDQTRPVRRLRIVHTSEKPVTPVAAHDLTSNKPATRWPHTGVVPPSSRLEKEELSSRSRRGERGFTMIEIAIAVGVIGFAMVAIIGILPRGMGVQKENREDTVISQDAPYFLEAIRNGEMRTNNNVLANYVESITISTVGGGNPGVFTYCNPLFTNGGLNYLTNDMAIVGYLSTPEYDPIRMPNQTNEVTAIVHGMNGEAVEQNGSNSVTSFRYQMVVEVDPWNYTTPGYVGPSNVTAYPYSPYNPYPTSAQMSYLASSLHDVRLRFAWPLLPNGSLGPNRQTYRTFVCSHLTNNSGLWFFQPQTYWNNISQ